MDHVGGRRKFVTFSEAVRTALRKMLDQFDEVDARHGRVEPARVAPGKPLLVRAGKSPSGPRVRWAARKHGRGGGL